MSEPAVHSDATLRRRRRLSLTWAAVVVIWSLVRAIIVWAAVGDYGLNPWIYLVIDLCSASVDAFTTPRMVLRFIDDHFRKAAGWALVSLGAFIVPDIYIFVGSRTLPKKLVVIIVAIIALTLVLAVVGVARKVRHGRKLRAELVIHSVGASAASADVVESGS